MGNRKKTSDSGNKQESNKLRIVLLEDGKKNILDKDFSKAEGHVGLISIEKQKDTTEFTIRAVETSHIRYHYDPKTQKFELQFLSHRSKDNRNTTD
jgi:hypothetical protein